MNHSHFKFLYDLKKFPPVVLEISQQISKTVMVHLSFVFPMQSPSCWKTDFFEGNGAFLFIVGGSTQSVLITIFHNELKEALELSTQILCKSE